MNWRLKIVLWFVGWQKPLDPKSISDIANQRKKADAASRLGTKILDRPVSILKTTDVDAGGVPVRIYQNSTALNQRVIVYYHGGGFVLYGLDSHDNVCRRLCKMNNCMVVSVDYRLAPEHTFPAAHDDAYTALQWVIKNIHNYGGNAEDLVLAGDSAGGNLSACMAHRCKKENIQLKAQILIYPWIDGKLDNPSIERNGRGYLLLRETMFLFQALYTPKVEDRCVPSLSPCYETDFTGITPTFILTAEFDPLIDDGLKYFNQLKDAGNKAIYKEYKGLVHGFFNLPRVAPAAKQSYYDIAEFLKGIE